MEGSSTIRQIGIADESDCDRDAQTHSLHRLKVTLPPLAPNKG